MPQITDKGIRMLNEVKKKIKRCPLSFSTVDYMAQECIQNDCGWYCEKTERCAIVSIAGQLAHIRQNVLGYGHE